MIRRVFDIIEEPRGEMLRRLMRAAARHATVAMLVLRDELGVNEVGQALLRRLQPHLRDQGRRSSWPGTNLQPSGEAIVLRFALRRIVLDQLSNAVDGLYEWRQPMLPEDLTFLRIDGTTVLGSISHERDAFLEITDNEYASITRSVPEITRIILPHSPQESIP